MPTSNRFKKSIESATENTAAAKRTKKEAEAPSAPPNDILADILGEGKKGRGASHTLYLSAEVGEALAQYAEQHKTSKSTIVDAVLRSVLLK